MSRAARNGAANCTALCSSICSLSAICGCAHLGVDGLCGRGSERVSPPPQVKCFMCVDKGCEARRRMVDFFPRLCREQNHEIREMPSTKRCWECGHCKARRAADACA